MRSTVPKRHPKRLTPYWALRSSEVRNEGGYTIIELLVAMAMLTALIVGGVEFSLSQQPVSLTTAIAQFSAMLEETRSLARANAGGWIGSSTGSQAVADSGATLYVAPDPNDPSVTVATLYWYRPIAQNHCRGCVQPDLRVPPLRLHVSLTINIPTPFMGTSPVGSAFALFVSPSGHVSAITSTNGNGWNPTRQWSQGEPVCDAANPPTITFSAIGTQKTMALMCQGASIASPTPQQT